MRVFATWDMDRFRDQTAEERSEGPSERCSTKSNSYGAMHPAGVAVALLVTLRHLATVSNRTAACGKDDLHHKHNIQFQNDG